MTNWLGRERYICFACERDIPETEQSVKAEVWDGYQNRTEWFHDWCKPAEPDYSDVTDRQFNRTTDRSSLYG